MHDEKNDKKATQILLCGAKAFDLIQINSHIG